MFLRVINKALLDECPFIENASRSCLLGVDTDKTTGFRFRRRCRESDYESCVRFMTTMLFKSRGRRVGFVAELAEK